MTEQRVERDTLIGELLATLPAPPDDDLFLDRVRAAALADAPQNRHGRHRGRRLSMLRRRPLQAAAASGLACLVLGLAVGASLATTTKTGARDTRATPRVVSQIATLAFPPSAGWTTVAATASFPDLRQQVAWVTNGRTASDEATTAWPVQTVRSLPPDGIVVWVALGTTANQSPYPAATPPLDLSTAELHTGQYEMQPAPNVSMLGPLSVTVNGYPVQVFVWFGRDQPTAAQLDQAQQQVNRLQFPSPRQDGDPASAGSSS
jgi:hypothetical protein